MHDPRERMEDQISEISAVGRRLAARGQLSDEAADYIRELIVSGALPPGARVIAESFAKALGISVTPMREGLLALRVEGFLILEPRRGFVVAPLSSSDIRDVFTALALLVGEEAARVATWAQAEDLEPLRRLTERMSAAADRGDDLEVEDLSRAWYRTLHEIAGMPKISSMVLILAKHAPHGVMAEVESSRALVAGHTAVLERIAAGDPDGARAAVEGPLRHAADLVSEHFARLDAAPREGLSRPS